jgi:hypothetical protein
METNNDVAGAFLEIALCWSVVDRAKSAGLDEIIDLSSFNPIGPKFLDYSGMIGPHLFLD